MLSAALRYAKVGWPVFPCKPGEKNPLTENGFLDATTDVGQIGLWWVRWPTANVGIATGYPGPDVVDFDVKHDAPGEDSYHKLVSARMLADSFFLVFTPSGGAHIYFAGTEQRRSINAALGVDFLGRGGYALAPPSRIYTFEDGVVVDEDDYVVWQQREPTGATIEWQRVKEFLVPPVAPRVFAPTNGVEPSKDARIAGVLSKMGTAVVGERNHMLYWAAKRLVECDASQIDFLDLHSVAEKVGMTEAEDGITKTIKSAQR
jgi:hypothetical protein